MGAYQSKPPPPPPPKLCLIPPQIFKYKPKYFLQSDIQELGIASRELINDFFVQNDDALDVSGIPNTPLTSAQYDVGATQTNFRFPQNTLIHSFGLNSMHLTSRRTDSKVDTSSPNAHGGQHIDFDYHPTENMFLDGCISVSKEEGKQPQSFFTSRVGYKNLSAFALITPNKTHTKVSSGFKYQVNALRFGAYFEENFEKDKPLKLGNGIHLWCVAAPSQTGIFLGTQATFNQNTLGTFNFTVGFLNKGEGRELNRKPQVELAARIANGGESVTLSYFQHFAFRRLIYNPVEDTNTTHITNYVDVGTSVTMKDDQYNLGVAASWQINKNWMIKAKADNEHIQGAIVIRNWNNPGFSLGLNLGTSLRAIAPRFGLSLSIDGIMDTAEYERSPHIQEAVKYNAELAPENISKYNTPEKFNEPK